MFAFIVAAGDVWQSSLCVGGRGARENLSGRIVRGQSSHDAAHAPGATKVQAIKVNKFRISAVGDNCRLQELLRLVARYRGQKPMEPRGEFALREHAPHEISFDQSRRKGRCAQAR